MARCIDDDEFAARRGEEAVGNVDGYFLLAFGGEAVQQQRKIELAALGAELARVAFERVKLILEQLLRFVQQTPEQCRLAVVDRSAGDESQQTRARLPLQQRGEFIIGDLRLGIHQK